MILEVLVRDDNFNLVHETLQSARKTVEYLETFWQCSHVNYGDGYGKIQIAVICGEDGVFPDSSLSNNFAVRDGAHVVYLFSDDTASPIFAKSICISVNDLKTIDPQNALNEVFTTIRETLLKVADRMQSENGNEQEIRIAQQGLQNACEQIRKICLRLDYRLTELDYASEISSLLVNGRPDENDGVKDGFPTLRILVLLSEEAFANIAKFAEPKYYFFKQIRWVIHNEPPGMVAVKMDFKRQLEEKDRKYSEDTEKLQKQLEEKDKKIDEELVKEAELQRRLAEETEEKEHYKKLYESKRSDLRNNDGSDEQKGSDEKQLERRFPKHEKRNEPKEEGYNDPEKDEPRR